MTTLRNGRTVVPWRVPVIAQFASPELTAAILAGRLEPSADPRWADFGFSSRGAYGFWAPRLCGIACLAMVIRAAQPTFDQPLAALVAECYEGAATCSGTRQVNGWTTGGYTNPC